LSARIESLVIWRKKVKRIIIALTILMSND
jgi:hypothetical protein